MLTPHLFLVYLIIFSSLATTLALMSWARKHPMQNVINEIESIVTMITNCIVTMITNYRTIFFEYKIKDIPNGESFSFSFCCGGQRLIGADLLGMIQCQKHKFHPSSWFFWCIEKRMNKIVLRSVNEGSHQQAIDSGMDS